MSANSYGIIVEGAYDSAVYDPPYSKVGLPQSSHQGTCLRGKANLGKKFPGLLRTFEYEIGGDPVDMAIVIVDADGRDPLEVEEHMRRKVQGRNYPFPLNVRFYAVPQAMDAWLLADAAAISAAVQGKGGKPITKSHDDPERLLNPKEVVPQASY